MTNGMLPRFLLEPTGLEPLERWFNWPTGRTSHGVVPAMDVHEDANHLVVTMELPGLAKEQVEVTLENGLLTVGGEKSLERDVEGQRYHARERATGSFRRSVSLPTDVDAAKAEASFDKGVLTIRIPKSEAVKPKRLAIR